MTLPTLNLIGPGRLGQTLAHCWQRQGLLQIAGLAGRDPVHTEAARAFIGGGEPATLHSLPMADFTLIATPDAAIADTALQLRRQGRDWRGAVVFHCSGALSSDALTPLRAAGAAVASIHPLKSFADPFLAAQTFAGTWCGCEGDADALDRLAPLFDKLGGHRFSIDAAQKTLYHAAAVLACNNLVSLMDAALRSMAAAGVPHDIAWPALRPLIDGTLRNLDQLSTAAALTGPIARGDAATVARQQAATTVLDPTIGDTYRALGTIALQLATLDEAQRNAIRQALAGQA
jgi:predicted short-subunit dehydrogenase-like oxidoreductase (DUF2520 family)